MALHSEDPNPREVQAASYGVNRSLVRHSSTEVDHSGRADEGKGPSAVSLERGRSEKLAGIIALGKKPMDGGNFGSHKHASVISSPSPRAAVEGVDRLTGNSTEAYMISTQNLRINEGGTNFGHLMRYMEGKLHWANNGCNKPNPLSSNPLQIEDQGLKKVPGPTRPQVASKQNANEMHGPSTSLISALQNYDRKIVKSWEK